LQGCNVIKGFKFVYKCKEANKITADDTFCSQRTLYMVRKVFTVKVLRSVQLAYEVLLIFFKLLS